MIEDGNQYKVTQSQLERLEKVLDNLYKHPENAKDLDPRIAKAQIEGVESLIETLREEMVEYEQLIKDKDKIFHFDSLSQLPPMLLKARIVAGLTQEHLAEKAGLKVEQIERFEDTGYTKANWRQLLAVSNALGIKVNLDLQFPEPMPERIKEAS
jgi:DNA-binding XRE family transcriptional regulator